MTHQIASEEIVRLTVELSPSGMIMTDADGKIVLVNAEVERLFGYRRDELLGRSIDILVPKEMRAAHDGYRQGFVARPEARRMGVGRDLYGMRKDGSKVPVEIGLNPIHTSDGQMILSAVTDITERKLAVDALAARSEELQRSNADLEQFAHVASHDLQEPLRMVSSYTELLAEHFKGRLDEKAEKYIHYAVDGAKRMQQLVRDLLAYSRVDTQGKLPTPIKSEIVVSHF
jgi:PAS domain S-box-containing protein